VGVAVLAYTLGLRHAFDADHISAIDNCTRKVLGERRELFGTVVSAAFLLLIGLLNLVVLAAIVRVFASMRRGEYDEAELERQLANRGLFYRSFGRWMKVITKEWQLGVLQPGPQGVPGHHRVVRDDLLCHRRGRGSEPAAAGNPRAQQHRRLLGLDIPVQHQHHRLRDRGAVPRHLAGRPARLALRPHGGKMG
jgi:High-affinity nickel-transport protein